MSELQKGVGGVGAAQSTSELQKKRVEGGGTTQNKRIAAEEWKGAGQHKTSKLQKKVGGGGATQNKQVAEESGRGWGNTTQVVGKKSGRGGATKHKLVVGKKSGRGGATKRKQVAEGSGRRVRPPSRIHPRFATEDGFHCS